MNREINDKYLGIGFLLLIIIITFSISYRSFQQIEQNSLQATVSSSINNIKVGSTVAIIDDVKVYDSADQKRSIGKQKEGSQGKVVEGLNRKTYRIDFQNGIDGYVKAKDVELISVIVSEPPVIFIPATDPAFAVGVNVKILNPITYSALVGGINVTSDVNGIETYEDNSQLASITVAPALTQGVITAGPIGGAWVVDFGTTLNTKIINTCLATSVSICPMVLSQNAGRPVIAQSQMQTFLVNYTLTVQRNGTGTGLVRSVTPPSVIYCSSTNPTCSASFVGNTTVTLSAITDTGSTFTGWSGGSCVGTNTNCTVLMDQARTAIATFTALPATQRPPWRNFNLSTWKIQITAKPAPTDYFPQNFDASATEMTPWWYTDATDPLAPMVFTLDSYKNPASGTTLRSELREVIDGYSNYTNWNPLVGRHTINARIKVDQISGMPDQITVLQIHPYANINPLLRISWNRNTSNINNSTIKVFYKTDATGDVTSSVTCSGAVGIGAFDLEAIVENQQMKVNLNGVRCLTHSIPYWSHEGYFKAGAYPQAYSGVSRVKFYRLDTTHTP